ncbi:MAG: phospholipid carrier-dependent glycosyltransferase [Acidobacteria bacterium]|nr:phospholipid carrier-dependent glycosyltransferase [Acidobacteriota bacterium]
MTKAESPPEKRIATGVVVLAALAGPLLAWDHARLDSATMDEPFHALSSAEYAASGTYFANIEHPPLAKLLAGFSMTLAGARPPRIPQPFEIRTAEQPREFLYGNDIPAQSILRAGRLPFVLVFGLFVLLAGAVVARLATPAAGAVAAVLLAFEPTHVAHAGALHTDLLASFFFVLTLALFLAALARVSAHRSCWAPFAAAGLALGLACSAKFSCVFLVPCVVLVGLFAALKAPEGSRRSRVLLGLGLSLGTSVIGLLGPYALALRNMTPAGQEGAIRLFLEGRIAPEPTIERVLSVARALPPLGHYVAGLTGIAQQNDYGGGVNFLCGRLSVDGFWNYFLVAFFVKSALGVLALLLGALVLTFARRGEPFDLPVAALSGTAAFLFLQASTASYNIGVRHILPSMALLLLAGVVVLSRALPRRAFLLVGGLCALVTMIETGLVHPFEISFFNAAAGGPANGERWLNDSNLDWGQDLLRARSELERRGLTNGVLVAYFGGADPSREVPFAWIFEPGRPAFPPGTYAVSSFLEHVGPALLVRLSRERDAQGLAQLLDVLRRRGQRIGRVGYSIHLYRVAPEGAPPQAGPPPAGVP